MTLAHRDHVHIGLSRAGARKRTSFWAGRAASLPSAMADELSPENRIRIEVDRGLCIGSGDCVDTAPGVFELDAEDKARGDRPRRRAHGHGDRGRRQLPGHRDLRLRRRRASCTRRPGLERAAAARHQQHEQSPPAPAPAAGVRGSRPPEPEPRQPAPWAWRTPRPPARRGAPGSGRGGCRAPSASASRTPRRPARRAAPRCPTGPRAAATWIASVMRTDVGRQTRPFTPPATWRSARPRSDRARGRRLPPPA